MSITASIVGPTFITVMMDGVTHTINGDHPHYQDIRDALKDKNHVVVEKLINLKKTIVEYASGLVRIVGDQVYYGDSVIKNSVVTRIIEMNREGFDAKPMMYFLENLMKNPSKRSVDELYGFLEATKLPITDDGFFLAYKKIRNDWKDFYTGTVPHDMASSMSSEALAELPKTFGNVTVSVENGLTTLSMIRNQVNDNKDQTCSDGLHFCSLSYLPQYHGGQGRVIIVKINPADVVSIPSDYNNAKGRACRYSVVGENQTDSREKSEYFTSPVYQARSESLAPLQPSPAPRSEQPSAVNKFLISPALIGYNKGRQDGSSKTAYNDVDARFTGDAAKRYADSYAKGYQSVGIKKPAPTNSAEYQEGYNDALSGKSHPASGARVLRGPDYARGWRDAKLASSGD